MEIYPVASRDLISRWPTIETPGIHGALQNGASKGEGAEKEDILRSPAVSIMKCGTLISITPHRCQLAAIILDTDSETGKIGLALRLLRSLAIKAKSCVHIKNTSTPPPQQFRISALSATTPELPGQRLAGKRKIG